MPNWTPEEDAEAARDAVALLRAMLDGRHDDIRAILDAAGDRGVRCIAESLVAAAYDQFVRVTLATSAIDDERSRAAIRNGPIAQAVARPEVRAVLEADLDAMRRRLLASG